MANPTIDTSKVLLHVQTRASDVTNQVFRTVDANKHTSNRGSNNAEVTNDTNAMPISEFQSVIHLKYPDMVQGVHRNLLGLDDANDQISAEDNSFNIRGFYSEKHQNAFLQSISNIPTFFLNGVEPETTTVIAEVGVQIFTEDQNVVGFESLHEGLTHAELHRIEATPMLAGEGNIDLLNITSGQIQLEFHTLEIIPTSNGTNVSFNEAV